MNVRAPKTASGYTADRCPGERIVAAGSHNRDAASQNQACGYRDKSICHGGMPRRAAPAIPKVSRHINKHGRRQKERERREQHT